jgi:predicted ATPase/DNA-binding winged helix-turn-helix (wHTH) protein
MMPPTPLVQLEKRPQPASFLSLDGNARLGRLGRRLPGILVVLASTHDVHDPEDAACLEVARRRSDRAAGMSEASFLFGDFEFSVAPLQLSRDGTPVPVGSRALAVLRLLLERAGETVSNRKILAEVWPGLFVEETNIRVHVSALRRALGSGARIINNPGLGYRFEADVRRAAPRVEAPLVPAESRHRLPSTLAPLLGRSADLEHLVAALPTRRFVTVVGPGGIGKTSFALAVGRALDATFRDGACFVDLASVSGGELVLDAAARRLLPGSAPVTEVAALGQHLRDRQMLVLLDNCEHVIDEAALLAEGLLKAAPGLMLLATSREALRAEGEWLHRLGPLAVPDPAEAVGPDQARGFAAVQLFMDRAASTGVELAPRDILLAASICRQLDGLPLAIELAAARVETFGMEGLEKLLGDRLSLLTGGRRTAAARHRTLQATLDWSHGLLSPAEQAAYRSLGIFQGCFTQQEAAAVIGEAPDDHEVAERLENLATKSLLYVALEEDQVLYRMLDTTRHDATRRLREAGEAVGISQAHARQLRAGIGTLSVADVRRRIDDLRAALNWCFGVPGDAFLGFSLTAAAAPAFFGLSLMAEYRRHAERALAALEGVEHDPKEEMALLVALGPAIYNTAGPVPEARACFERALPLAEATDDGPVQQRALWGLFLCGYGRARYGEALEHADEFVRRSQRWGDPTCMGPRMQTLALVYGGDAPRALALAEQTLASPAARAAHGPSGFQFEQRAVAGALRARALWLLGRIGEAVSQMETAVDEAVAGGHALSICFVMTHAACPISFWLEDDAATERYLDLLFRHSAAQSLAHWNRSARLFRLALDARSGLAPLAAADTLTGPEWSDGNLEALAVTDLGVLPERLLGSALQAPPVWCTAEILRNRARILLEQGPETAAEGEALLVRALDTARTQGLLIWALRAATDLARLRRGQGRGAEAGELLAATLGMFTDNHPVPDRRRAEALLAGLHAVPAERHS